MARIGIDLGTTNSAAATFITRDEPVVLSIGESGSRLVPSIVYPKKDGMLIGARAKARWPDVFFSVKRLMGRRYDDEVVGQVRERVSYEIVPATGADGTEDTACVKLGDVTMTPVQVSAEILRKIRADVEAKLKEKVTHAVVTVPAYFYDSQRAATREAGRLAGLRISQILDEPTAAALRYGVATGGDGVRRVLVYDLGGGTFDISLITVADGIPEVETTEGDIWCGGDDFDYLIMDHVLEQVDARHRGSSDDLRS
jgi:molecular chaperone DnaK